MILPQQYLPCDQALSPLRWFGLDDCKFKRWRRLDLPSFYQYCLSHLIQTTLNAVYRITFELISVEPRSPSVWLLIYGGCFLLLLLHSAQLRFNRLEVFAQVICKWKRMRRRRTLPHFVDYLFRVLAMLLLKDELFMIIGVSHSVGT